MWTNVERSGNVPAFPVHDSDAVIQGAVNDAQAVLTDDQTAIYSAFRIRVDTVFKPAPGVQVGGSVVALRRGGALKLPNGLLRTRQTDQLMPATGGTYVLFLKSYAPDDPAFLILIGYQLDGGTVSALDILPEPMRYDGSTETSFLATLRADLP